MKKTLYIILLLVIANIQWAEAQQNTLYFMTGMPHASLHANPAYQPHCKVFVGLPIMPLPTMDLSIGFTGWSSKDMFYPVNGTIRDSSLNIAGMIDKAANKNYINLGVNMDIINFGFRTEGKMYWTFGIRQRVESHFGIPKGLFSLINSGNFDMASNTSRTLSFSGFGLNAMSFTETAIGASKEIQAGGSPLILGARIKYLRGNANINFKRSKLQIDTDPKFYDLTLRADYEIRMSAPVDVYESNGMIDSVLEKDKIDANKDFLNAGNHGLGLDLGAVYKFDSKTTFSAAIQDLGFIKWKTNATVLKCKGDFIFPGVEVALVDRDTSKDNSLLDSIKKEFQFVKTNEAYKTGLYTQINLAASYQILEKILLGALIRTVVYDRKPHPSLTLSANFKPFKWLHASLSYSIINRSFSNLGYALVIGNRGYQFYTAMDNFGAALFPKNARLFNYRMGFVMMFGCKEKQDQSLIE